MNQAIFKIEDLTKPIALNNPCGKNLRQDDSFNSQYYQIKEIRNEARQLERRQLFEGESTTSVTQWEKVYELAIDSLKKETKDLELCAWLIEASLRLYGFEALKQSFQLTRTLIDQYWPSIHPANTKDQPDYKTAGLAALNGENRNGALITPINSIPITQSNSCQNFCLWEYQQALGNASKENKTLLKKIQMAAQQTPPEYFEQLKVGTLEALNAFSELNQSLEAKCSNLAPPYSNIQKAIKNYQYHLELLTKALPSPKHPSSKNEDLKHSKIVSKSKSISSRQQAMNDITNIAEYFKRHEPHSPLPYLLNRAAYWGNLPLPELLKEMVSNPEERKQIFKLTGIAKNTDPEDQ